MHLQELLNSAEGYSRIGTQNSRMFSTFGVPSNKMMNFTQKPTFKDFQSKQLNENKRNKKKKEKEREKEKIERRGSNKGNFGSTLPKNPKKKKSSLFANSESQEKFHSIKVIGEVQKEEDSNMDEEEKKYPYRPILKKKITVPSNSDLDSQLSLSVKSKSFILKDKEMSEEPEIKKHLSFFLEKNPPEMKRK